MGGIYITSVNLNALSSKVLCSTQGYSLLGGESHRHWLPNPAVPLTVIIPPPAFSLAVWVHNGDYPTKWGPFFLIDLMMSLLLADSIKIGEGKGETKRRANTSSSSFCRVSSPNPVNTLFSTLHPLWISCTCHIHIFYNSTHPILGQNFCLENFLPNPTYLPPCFSRHHFL